MLPYNKKQTLKTTTLIGTVSSIQEVDSEQQLFNVAQTEVPTGLETNLERRYYE